ncbi:YhgE/Pip domain-containing protein [Labedella phragmitis]|uniref:YhgE/Pip domain-containing protein n=1 Tax=Labedella phragmitis TaxID=2498849 RepID=A0A444PUD2_9MICO|nr:YhgE/Pip domain-containing protein [Labedella phragmitis]RWZ51484.1 YhgE/Pip domain-containing protein [Labedella phragmitis]
MSTASPHKPTLRERLLGSRRLFVVLFGIAIIPLIYAGALIWSNEDPTHNLDAVPAAIVDLDTGATPNTDDAKPIDLGRDLADELLSNDESTNFDWREESADEATADLAAGDVLVVLTVPEDFSSAAVSPAADDSADARAARLSIETNDGANVVVGSVATSVGTAVTETLSSQVSAEYLENVYLGFSEIHDRVADASDGADELAAGAADASNGAGDLVVGLSDLTSGAVDLSDGASTLAAGATSAEDGAQRLSSGLSDLEDATSALPGKTAPLDTGSDAVAGGAHDVAVGASELASKAALAATSAETIATGAADLPRATQQLESGTSAVSSGLSALIDDYAGLTDAERLVALQRLAATASALDSGAQTLTEKSAQLAGGTAALVGTPAKPGLTALAAGADTLVSGAADVDSGAGELAAGVDTLVGDLDSLVTAVSDAATGASTLADGTAQVSAGAAALASGGATLADGASSASDGARQLDDGLASLRSGSTDLSDGLSSGVDDIPDYSESDASRVSEVASAPVRLNAERVNEVPAYGWGLAPYFMSLALWVGALAFYLMMKPLRESLVASGRPAWFVALGSFVPGAVMGVVQSALMVTIVHLALGIEAASLGGLYAIAALASVTFVAMNQALVSLLGAPGRFIGLMLVVLQLSSAGGTYPIQTAATFFQTLHGWFPLTYAVESFRSLIAGGEIGIAPGIGVMSVWLLGSLLVTTVAAARARRDHTPTGVSARAASA